MWNTNVRHIINSIETDEVKIRRGGSGTAGLFAFPRVGRRDPSMMEYNPWDNVLPYTYEEYDMGNYTISLVLFRKLL